MVVDITPLTTLNSISISNISILAGTTNIRPTLSFIDTLNTTTHGIVIYLRPFLYTEDTDILGSFMSPHRTADNVL